MDDEADLQETSEQTVSQTFTPEADDNISEITFNNGETLNVGKGDIIVFVGPNNVGKSQSLKDIYVLCGGNHDSAVIKSVKLNKAPVSALRELIKSIAVKRNMGDYQQFEGYKLSANSYELDGYANVEHFGFARDILISNLDTENRLIACRAAGAITRDSPRQHPIHYSAFDSQIRQQQSKVFRKAFGVDLTPDTQFGAEFPMRMGIIPTLDESIENSQDRVEKFGESLSQLMRVDQQGDGIRSFVGILLSLSIPHYRIVLIDEPESFLHPPQAFIMGRTIGQMLEKGKQAFISTHSQDVVKGLLEECPDRVKIVRITREGTRNHFNILEKGSISSIYSDPLLRHSEILNGMFHKNLVLCESDCDCKFYSIIDSAIKETAGCYSEALFVHCGGKDRMRTIAEVLRKLGLEFHIIADMDVLSDENCISAILNNCGGDWQALKKSYNVLDSGLQGRSGYPLRDEVRAAIIELLDKEEGMHLSKQDCQSARKLFTATTKWSQIKEGGVSAVPGGNCRVAFDEINSVLENYHIHLVPCGELERFVPQVEGHGPKWVNQVLEKYPNLDDGVYTSAKQFVASLNI